MEKKRIGYIDLYRGIGILIMIMGHVGFGNKFDLYIHAFHMPMFYFISGYLFKKVNDIQFVTFLNKKCVSLLIPYIVIGCFHYVVWLLLEYPAFSLYPLIHLLSYNTGDIPIAGALWFLTSLFICDVIYFLLNLCSNRKLVTVMILVIIGYAYFIPVELPWAMNSSLIGIGFMHIGYIIRAYEKSNVVKRYFGMPWYLCGIVFIGISLLIFYNGSVNMRSNDYSNIFLFYFNATVISILLIRVCKEIEDTKFNCTFLDRFIKKCGSDSLFYLSFNQIVIMFVAKILRIIGISSITLKSIVAFIIVVIVLAIGDKIIMKTPIIKHLFGGK